MLLSSKAESLKCSQLCSSTPFLPPVWSMTTSPAPRPGQCGQDDDLVPAAPGADGGDQPHGGQQRGASQARQPHLRGAPTASCQRLHLHTQVSIWQATALQHHSFGLTRDQHSFSTHSGPLHILKVSAGAVDSTPTFQKTNEHLFKIFPQQALLH